MTVLNEHTRADELEQAEKAVATCEESYGRDGLRLGPLLTQLAALYYRDGLYAKAELALRRCLDLESSPNAKALSRLGSLYLSEGKLDDAESAYLKALAAAERQSEDGRQFIAERSCSLAGLYLKKQQPAQAQDLLKKAVAAYRSVDCGTSCQIELCLITQALVCHMLGQSAAADQYYQQACLPAATPGAPGSEERAFLELVRTYYGQGRLAEVDGLLSGSLLSDESRFWPEFAGAARIQQERGELFRAQGYFEDAERCFKRALEIRSTVLGNGHPAVAESALSLATMYLSQNRCADAEPVLRCALQVRVRAFGVESPAVAACIETYASLLKRTRRGAIAGKLEARARDIRTRLVQIAERTNP